MDINYFLGEGKFTKRDGIVKNSLAEALSLEGRTTILGKISLYLETKLSFDESKKKVEFRKRTASEIIDSKLSGGCTDYCLAFCVLAREAGIPTKYLETIEENNLLNCPSRYVNGHIFSKIFLDNDWKIYEPLKGFRDNFYFRGRKYIQLASGLDFSELTLRSSNAKINLNSLRKIKNLRNKLSKVFPNL
jgi:hypothetical protein